MCSKPDIPDPPPPPQEVKQPDTAVLKDKAKQNREGIMGGTLLTSPQGAAAAPTARTTLLGQ